MGRTGVSKRIQLRPLRLARPSVLGDGLPERLRSTLVGLLGIAGAAGAGDGGPRPPAGDSRSSSSRSAATSRRPQHEALHGRVVAKQGGFPASSTTLPRRPRPTSVTRPCRKTRAVPRPARLLRTTRGAVLATGSVPSGNANAGSEATAGPAFAAKPTCLRPSPACRPGRRNRAATSSSDAPAAGARARTRRRSQPPPSHPGNGNAYGKGNGKGLGNSGTPPGQAANGQANGHSEE